MSSTHFSDEPIRDRDYDIPPMVNALVNSAKSHGPMVLEVWNCQKCKAETFAFHHFSETVSCGYCNHCTASKVPIYRHFIEDAADRR